MGSLFKSFAASREQRKAQKAEDENAHREAFAHFMGGGAWSDDSLSVPTAESLRTSTVAKTPFLDLFVPGYTRTLQEAPWDWDADPDVSSSPLSYTPLSAADVQIRVLTLLPAAGGDAGAPIRCTLETVSLLAPAVEPYDALSYMWGGVDGPPRTIDVDGRRFEATANLHAALRELRNKGFGRLWIDAVCINQDDREERSQQVLRMRSIYARARSTVVWLGPESPTSNLAMYLLKVLSDPGDFGEGMKPGYREAVKGRVIPEKKPARDGDADDADDDDDAAARTHVGLFADAWLAFDELFEREYWQRMWIIQEIAVSRDIQLLCGGEMISWAKVEVAFWGPSKASFTFNNPALNPTAGVDFSRAPRRTGETLFDFWGWRKAIAGGQPKTLLKALLDCRSSKATDPRDHVYALLGITMDGSIMVPVPNYALPVADVFTRLAENMISANQSLDIILLQPRSGVKATPGLPSWVPDWAGLAEVDRPWAHEFALRPGPKVRDATVQAFDAMTHGGYRTVIKHGVLCCSGRLYDVVDGLSGSVGVDGKVVGDDPTMGIVQPEIPTSCYPGILGTAEAIQQAMCMLLDWTREVPGRDRADLLTNCWGSASGGWPILTSRHRLLKEWLDANREFVVGSVKLELWLDQHEAGLHGLVNSVRMKSRSAAKALALRQRLDEWMTEVEAGLRAGMRLMTTVRGRVGLAHPQARRGDHVCIMEGMDSFVLLRPLEDRTAEQTAHAKDIEGMLRTQRYMQGFTGNTRFSDGYRVVGDAYVRTTGSAKEIENMSQCPFFTFFIH